MKHACAWPAPKGMETCLTLYRPQSAVNAALAAGKKAKPVGLTPRQLESAYRLPVSRTSHQTVAVSIAYNTPKLAHYLAVYRSYFGLPPCTVASGCFRQVNEHGKAAPLPASSVGSGWDLEVTLDVSMISVACPHCRIIVVEAHSASYYALALTDKTAARLGAQVISNSYGTRENGAALKYRKAYDRPGHTVVVAAGDDGYTAANFPADLATVTAVGGTQLKRAKDQRGWSERVWNNDIGAGGSGCSAYVAKPSWQPGHACSGRTVADVAAIAYNVPIYESYYGGWVTVAGTSIAAPFIAGVYGLAGNGSTIPLGYAYAHPSALFNITKGNNAWLVPNPKVACGDTYLCVAKKGYNAPTGMGTPDGIGAF
jgi:subtilase family serine protease